MEINFFLDRSRSFCGYNSEARMAELSKKNNELRNGDYPFDRFKIVMDDEGSYCAFFYIAARYRWDNKGFFLSLDDLQESQVNSRKEGLNSPLTSQAIRLLRQAMNLPELH